MTQQAHWDVYRAIARQQYETIKRDECQPLEAISDRPAQETADVLPAAASDEGADSEMEAQS